ncbi:T9SS type A sorting domain-containing protein [Rufibacter ruber]|uniref:T9SS type A sorting domain-containing protein n=1 Tax=Rufibacter ruber TaxID=1783499 RepID=UPI0009EDDEFA|nr:T9SS type A sorting domain-containing protein [Rufibacter ruber]
MKSLLLTVSQKMMLCFLLVLVAQASFGQVNNNGTSFVNGHIQKVSSVNNTLVVAFTLQSTQRRLANATLKFTYDETILQLQETPIAESPRDSDNKLSTGDYFFHNDLRGSSDSAPNNGYETLTVTKGLLPTGTTTGNKTYQININNQLMNETLQVNPASNISKFLPLDQTQTVLTLKFKIIGTGYANLKWLNEKDDFEIILLNEEVVDSEPNKQLTAETIFVQREEDKNKLLLASTGTGTVNNPILVNVTSRETFNLEAGSVGFYVYFNTANTSYDASRTRDLLALASNFGWPAGSITLEEIPLVFRSYTVNGSPEVKESYYNRRIRFVSSANGQRDDQWQPNAPQNVLSLVFNEVMHPTKGLQPIDIYLEAITGEQGHSTTFKNYDGLEHGVIELQREFDLQDNALPVTLTKFEASIAGNQVKLNWTTASELNNKEFVVERSKNAQRFEPVGTVEGNGTSNTLLSYSFTDTKPLAGTSYYRLKQVDFDGKSEYSKLISINHTPSAQESIAIISTFPNPFQNKIVLELKLAAAATIQVLLLDLNGKPVYTKNLAGGAGVQQYTVDNIGTLPNGIYLMKVVSGTQVAVQKLVKSF